MYTSDNTANGLILRFWNFDRLRTALTILTFAHILFTLLSSVEVDQCAP